MLRDAVIDRAKAVIIAAGVDDSNALILLTARHLNPKVRIIVSAKEEEENVKLFKTGGADTILSPATFGGYILAAAVDQRHMVQYLDDLLTTQGQIALVERTVRPDEIGKSPADLHPDLLLRLYRSKTMYSYLNLAQAGPLQHGDIMVLFTSSPTDGG